MTILNYHSRDISAVKDYCIKNKQTVAVAESVTGGHLQAALSSADNAIYFFQGGITVYNIGQKTKQLHVEPIEALACNCVSKTVAEQMARSCGEKFLSNYALAITGYASVVPELKVKKPFAIYSIAFNNKIIATRKISTQQTESIKVQIDFANQVIKAFKELLKK